MTAEELNERIEQIANDNGWSVVIPDGSDELEFETHNSFGGDVIVYIDTVFVDDLHDIANRLYQYAENYDESYEAYKHLGKDGHGVNGAPYHMKDVIASEMETRKMIYKLSEAYHITQREIDNGN